MEGLRTTIGWHNGSIYVSCTQLRRTVEELKVTTQHGVLKSPGTIRLPDRSEQAGPCPKEENSVTHSVSPRNNVNAPPPYLQSIRAEASSVIIKITETNQGLPPAPPAVLPCSGEPPAGMTGELFAGNGLLSNVSSVPTHNAAALSLQTTFRQDWIWFEASFISVFFLFTHFTQTSYAVWRNLKNSWLNILMLLAYECECFSSEACRWAPPCFFLHAFLFPFIGVLVLIIDRGGSWI